MTFPILVTGSRDWLDRDFIYKTLDACMFYYGKKHIIIVQGMARGADSMALTWAVNNQVDHACFYPHWDIYDNAAGPIRNARQADVMEPKLCLAFHPDIEKSKGTKNQVAYIVAHHYECRTVVLTGTEPSDHVDYLIGRRGE